MIKKLAYTIKHTIDYFMIKRTGISLPKSSYFKKPYRVEGGQYIFVGDNVSIREYSSMACFDNYAGIRYKPKIVIGDNVFANRFLSLLSADDLIIGDYTYLGSFVSITNENHGTKPGITCYGLQRKQLE